MRKITLFVALFCPLLCFSMITGDSTSYLTAKDTIFLKFSETDGKFFYHKIEPKQTLFSLSRFYGLDMTSLSYYNPEIKDHVISIGQDIKIPIPNRAIKRYKKNNFKDEEHVPICYTVQPGDNLFKISKRQFKMPVDTVMTRNNLANATLYPGQILQVGWMSISGIPKRYQRTKKESDKPLSKANERLKKRFDSSKRSKSEFFERGVAFWQKNAKYSSDLYALHRSAPINSIISIYNPMKNRTVYTKVIGRIPENVYGRDVLVVLSPKAANLLGAKDPRFFVKIKYKR